MIVDLYCVRSSDKSFLHLTFLSRYNYAYLADRANFFYYRIGLFTQKCVYYKLDPTESSHLNLHIMKTGNCFKQVMIAQSEYICTIPPIINF